MFLPTRFLIAATIVLLANAPALADDDTAFGFKSIPIECDRYRDVPGGSESPVGWDHLLSFGACIQDASIVRIDDPEELRQQIDDLADALDPALQLYLRAVEYGPPPIKLRASYQIALAMVALITRARSSIVAPQDLMTNTAAAAKYRALHAQLESRLTPAAYVAATGFHLIDKAATENPSLAADPVTKPMVRSARRFARILGQPQRFDEYEQR
jgi:hypothetical protein